MNSPAIDAIADHCIASRLRSLNRRITNLYDSTLRPLGLKISQLSILVAVAKFGLAQPRQLCRRLQLDTSTLSRNVERMRDRGWLEAVPAEDARMQPLRLTARGRQLLDRAVPAWKQAQRRATELLGQEGIAWLEQAIAKLPGPGRKQ
jgi:DNA-binding MarR family transcriptional regulator